MGRKTKKAIPVSQNNMATKADIKKWKADQQLAVTPEDKATLNQAPSSSS
ncbi:MAG: hypothetical protein IIC33_07315 [Chloroflexi bacterium]|nr:hypothetical protein [Chloroflexota bacterium]